MQIRIHHLRKIFSMLYETLVRKLNSFHRVNKLPGEIDSNAVYLRSGFEYSLEEFAPFHFPAEITTFQVELDELYQFNYSVSTSHTPKPQQSTKIVRKTLKNTSNFVKPVAIRPEIPSNFLIHFPSRTRSVLSNGHYFNPIPSSWWLEIAKYWPELADIPENLSRFG